MYQTKSDIGHIKLGSLEAFLASNDTELHASQELRYRVFCEEMGASASAEMKASKRDFDEFDDICDHLLVVDKDNGGKVVGSYRILRRSNLPAGRTFYTEKEYDISKTLTNFHGEVMELGRSCVDPNYRTRGTMQLLWRAIAAYVNQYNIELMFGCASFPGSDHKKHAMGLSFLYHHHLAPENIRARAKDGLYSPMNLVPHDQVSNKEAVKDMPPLVKGYLRLGAFVGDGAYEDKEYNTTDVCIILKTELVTQKYLDRYNK